MIHKLIDKYKNMSLPVKMAFWFLICSFIQKGICSVTTPIFTRIMSDSEFGRYGIYTSWNSIIAVFVTLSISGNCFTRGLVVLDDEKKERADLILIRIIYNTAGCVGHIVFDFQRTNHSAYLSD